MFIKESTVKAFTALIKAEYSTHLFFNYAANYAAQNGYTIAYQYFIKEATEEIGHTQKLQSYLLDMQAGVDFPTLDYTKPEFTSLIDIIQKASDLMIVVKDAYEAVCNSVLDEELTTFEFLQKFIKIQRHAIGYWSNLADTTKDLEPTKFNQLFIQQYLK